MLETFFAKLAGKFTSTKLKLEDGPMDQTKPWYKSRGVWTGVAATLIAAYGTASVQFGLPAVPEWIYAFLGALGVYSRVAADTKITS